MKRADVWKPNFDKGGGLIQVVAQDLNGHVLYVTTATELQWHETLETGRMRAVVGCTARWSQT